MKCVRDVRLCVAMTVVLGWATQSCAGTLSPMVSFPSGGLVVGNETEFVVYYHNERESDVNQAGSLAGDQTGDRAAKQKGDLTGGKTAGSDELVGDPGLTEEPLALTVPYQLQLLLDTTDAAGRPVQLTAYNTSGHEEKFSVPPSGFIKARFSVIPPAGSIGRFAYSLAGYEASGGLVAIQAPAVDTSERARRRISSESGESGDGAVSGASSVAADQKVVAATDTADSGPTEKQVDPAQQKDGHYSSMTRLEALYQSYAANFSMHEPVYFLVGTDAGKSRFQLSFKYRLFDPAGSLVRDHRWLQNIHLAYTQTSYWDLGSDSAPFEDTSYKPEILYLTENVSLRPSWLDGLFLQGGVRHESNGQAGDISRSTNTVYFKAISVFYDEESLLGFSLSPKVSAYFNNDETTNADFADYRGYFELESSIGMAHSWILNSITRFADRGTSFEANLTYPIHRLLNNNFDLYFQIQYTNSIAEKLIDYQERNEALRIGLSLVR